MSTPPALSGLSRQPLGQRPGLIREAAGPAGQVAQRGEGLLARPHEHVQHRQVEAGFLIAGGEVKSTQ
jgi:hypothetical protein